MSEGITGFPVTTGPASPPAFWRDFKPKLGCGSLGMKTALSKFNPDELNLIKLAQEYADEDKARELLESLRWPHGPVCPHCRNHGKDKPISKLTAQKPKSKTAVRKGVYFCGRCRKQFTVTVGTMFEGSHVKISRWLMAWSIVCSSRKAVSARQLHRMLGVTYKTAWFMAHRIRFAMGDSNSGQLGSVMEAISRPSVSGANDSVA
jgi:transposase-like protein